MCTYMSQRARERMNVRQLNQFGFSEAISYPANHNDGNFMLNENEAVFFCSPDIKFELRTRKKDTYTQIVLFFLKEKKLYE